MLDEVVGRPLPEHGGAESGGAAACRGELWGGGPGDGRLELISKEQLEVIKQIGWAGD